MVDSVTLALKWNITYAIGCGNRSLQFDAWYPKPNSMDKLQMVRKSVQEDNYKNKDQESALKPTISHIHEQRNTNFNSSVIVLCQKQAVRFNVLASMSHSIHVVKGYFLFFFLCIWSNKLTEKTAIKDELWHNLASRLRRKARWKMLWMRSIYTRLFIYYIVCGWLLVYYLERLNKYPDYLFFWPISTSLL